MQFQENSPLPPPVKPKNSYHKYKTYRCQTCGLGFQNVFDLRMHLLVDIEGSVICDECNQIFSTLKGMKQHYGKIHAKNRPSRCSVCKKRFRNKYALKFHFKQVHEQSTRQICTGCKIEVYNSYSLKRHQKKCKAMLGDCETQINI